MTRSKQQLDHLQCFRPTGCSASLCNWRCWDNLCLSTDLLGSVARRIGVVPLAPLQITKFNALHKISYTWHSTFVACVRVRVRVTAREIHSHIRLVVGDGPENLLCSRHRSPGNTPWRKSALDKGETCTRNTNTYSAEWKQTHILASA